MAKAKKAVKKTTKKKTVKKKAVTQPKVTQPKVLIYDIETAPIMSYVWRLWDQNVGLNQIEQDWNQPPVSAKSYRRLSISPSVHAHNTELIRPSDSSGQVLHISAELPLPGS